MNREYHRWHSPSLGRDMELLIFGHGGARVLVFPTSRGRFFEWEDRGMIAALSPQIEQGQLQLCCVDSVDAESWYNWGVHPAQRGWRQTQYNDYLRYEVLPLLWQKNPTPFTITTGASFGAYHAMNFGLRYPDVVNRILGMSGIYDISTWASGWHADHVYLNNPVAYIPNEHDSQRLELLYRLNIIMVAGTEDRLIHSARQLSGLLWAKGIGNALREWQGWNHDWPYWIEMLRQYIGGT